MDRMSLWRKLCGAIVVGWFAVVLTMLASPAMAYEEDTHYMVTYVICRAAGLSNSEALTAADYDQGMDDSSGTVANGGLGGVIPNVDEEHLWHAIPVDGKAQAVLQRKQVLWTQVLNERDAAMQLKRLGVFFHYEQDTWAHRHHENHDAVAFQPYSVPFGHAIDGHQPDRPPFDPVCALRCVEDSMGYARTFVTQCLHRTPAALFDNYHPASGQVDGAWNDGRKGKYFHQLASDASTPAHKFLTDLIRSQIDAYSSSIDANPSFLGRYTADEADYSKMRQHFSTVCSSNGVAVSIPAARTKITTLTTAQFQQGTAGNTSVKVKIKSLQNGQYMGVPDGVKDNSLIYCRAGLAPLEFTMEGDTSRATFYITSAGLCLNYRDLTGAVKLYGNADKAQYRLDKLRPGVYTIKNLAYNQYIWLSGDEPYLTRSGNASNKNAQWILEGLP